MNKNLKKIILINTDSNKIFESLKIYIFFSEKFIFNLKISYSLLRYNIIYYNNLKKLS